MKIVFLQYIPQLCTVKQEKAWYIDSYLCSGPSPTWPSNVGDVGLPQNGKDKLDHDDGSLFSLLLQSEKIRVQTTSCICTKAAQIENQ